MRKATQINLSKEIDKILQQYNGKLNLVIQESVEKVGADVERRMRQVSPVGNKPAIDKRFKDSWVTAIYNHQVYVGNTKQWKYGNARPPAINIMENTQRHPHYRFLTINWNAIKSEVENKLLQELKSKL